MWSCSLKDKLATFPSFSWIPAGTLKLEIEMDKLNQSRLRLVLRLPRFLHSASPVFLDADLLEIDQTHLCSCSDRLWICGANLTLFENEMSSVHTGMSGGQIQVKIPTFNPPDGSPNTTINPPPYKTISLSLRKHNVKMSEYCDLKIQYIRGCWVWWEYLEIYSVTVYLVKGSLMNRSFFIAPYVQRCHLAIRLTVFSISFCEWQPVCHLPVLW